MEALLLQDLSGFFENARQARKWLVALPLQYNTERIYKGAHAYIHLTGVCKVACEHCMYSSDYTARLPKPSLNSLEVDLANKYINDSGSQKLTISGGGEPFLKLNALLSLISKSFVPHIEIDTAGDWAISANKTVKILSSLSKALEENPNKPVLVLRISADKFHSVIAKNPVSISNYANIIRYWSEQEWGFKLALRGLLLEDDETSILIARAVLGNLEKVNDWNKLLVLPNGKTIPFTFNVLRFTGKGVNYVNSYSAKTIPMLDYYRPFHDENDNLVLGMAINDAVDGSYYKIKGLSITIDYDGSLFIYTATAPDMRANLVTHNFVQSIDHFYRDPITHVLLSDGLYSLLRLVAEIDEGIVTKSLQQNDMTAVVASLLSNENVLLYATLRSVQMLIKAGKIGVSDNTASLKFLSDVDKNILLGVAQVSYRKSR